MADVLMEPYRFLILDGARAGACKDFGHGLHAAQTEPIGDVDLKVAVPTFKRPGIARHVRAAQAAANDGQNEYMAMRRTFVTMDYRANQIFGGSAPSVAPLDAGPKEFELV